MKKIFIAYADAALAYSLKRIGRQARRLQIFDEVILYTPADLSEEIKAHPLMQYSRGGGYWLWKPWLIQKTLRDHTPGDIVVYADAGSTLRKSPEWERLFGLMPNKRYVMVIRRLVLEDEDPERLAREMNITAANLYNIKRRAMAQLARVALNDIQQYGIQQ